MVSQAK